LTVIYPTESPGGWNLIGRTPAEMFAIGANPPALLAPGDRVRFDPVGRAAFDDMERAAAAGDWMPEMEQ
ncbi:MAG: carboxyltransferase domain-containing protein, partial [Pseudomonadota bacterium]